MCVCVCVLFGWPVGWLVGWLGGWLVSLFATLTKKSTVVRGRMPLSLSLSKYLCPALPACTVLIGDR